MKQQVMITRPGAGTGRRDVRLLFTCAGRRVELISAFIDAARRLGMAPAIHTADHQSATASACLAEAVHVVPGTQDAAYVPSLLRIVKRERIDMLIPLVDHELYVLAGAIDRFASAGCLALVSSPEVVGVCRDKLAMYRFLQQRGIDTPETWPAEEVLERRRHRFPYFLKPRHGSAGKGNYVLHTREELLSLVPRVPEPIVQEFVPGIEYTLDVYTGYDGVPRCAVPRQRLEVRGGEVTQARTVRHEGAMQAACRVASALGGCRGVITIQLIVTPQDRIRIIEVNPRFGGGVPLAIEAGADFPRWLLSEWLGRRPRIRRDHFRDGVTMLRYYQAFFLEDGEVPPARIPVASRAVRRSRR